MVIILKYQPCALAYHEEESHASDWLYVYTTRIQLEVIKGEYLKNENFTLIAILYAPVADEEIATTSFK